MAYLIQCPEDVFKEAIETYKYTAKQESVKWYRLKPGYFVIRMEKTDWLNVVLSNRKISYIIIEHSVLKDIANSLK